MVTAEAVRDQAPVHDACPAVGLLPVQATPDQRPTLVAQAADSIAAVVAVADRQVSDGGRRVRLATAGGAVVRVVAAPAADPRSHPPQTVLVFTFVDDPGTLPPDQLREIVAAGGRVGFTGLEISLPREQMPLTAGMPAHLPPRCLARMAPVLTMHHMTDFLVMVETIQAMGVPPQLITVIDKGYRYRHTGRVDAHLRAQGISVYHWSDTAYADLVLAALLVGAANLATPGHEFQPGHNVAATDRMLESSGLLERYYQHFGPHKTGGPT